MWRKIELTQVGVIEKKPEKELKCSGDGAATEREVYNARQRSRCYSNPQPASTM